jgi:3'-phosphoadenosine 5'-phosphosulfate sulfotransferase (PAPS reductase)/FAD synthetase
MLWKGRTPGVKSQFCTEKLKLEPVKAWMNEIRRDREVLNYIGVRAQESERRSKLPERNFSEFYDAWVVRPLLRWSTDQVFAFLTEKGVPPNPLYGLGYGRVGCFPCIHANKSELSILPDWAWDKLEEWESRVGRSWFAFGTVPLSSRQKGELAQIAARHGFTLKDIAKFKKREDHSESVLALLADVKTWKDANSPSVQDVRRWSKTTRGGAQDHLFAPDQKDVPSCMSTWGICE